MLVNPFFKSDLKINLMCLGPTRKVKNSCCQYNLSKFLKKDVKSLRTCYMLPSASCGQNEYFLNTCKKKVCFQIEPV